MDRRKFLAAQQLTEHDVRELHAGRLSADHRARLLANEQRGVRIFGAILAVLSLGFGLLFVGHGASVAEPVVWGPAAVAVGIVVLVALLSRVYARKVERGRVEMIEGTVEELVRWRSVYYVKVGGSRYPLRPGLETWIASGVPLRVFKLSGWRAIVAFEPR